MQTKNKIIMTSVLVVLFVFSAVNYVSAEEEPKIPSWVKGIFGFYADDSINDNELIGALQFLIKNDIIDIGSQSVETESIDTSEIQSENRQLKQEVAKLEDERKIFLGPYESLDEFVEAQEKATNSWEAAVYEAEREASNAKQEVDRLDSIVNEHVDAYWAEVEKVSDLEKQVEELKAQIEELQN